MKFDMIYFLAIIVAFVVMFPTFLFLAIYTGHIDYIVLTSLMVLAIAFSFIIYYIYRKYKNDIRNMRSEILEFLDESEDFAVRDYKKYSSSVALSEFYDALTEARAKFKKRKEDQAIIFEIAKYAANHAELQKVLENVMPAIAKLSNSNCAAFYMVSGSTRLNLKYSLGFSKNIFSEFDINIGEGFVGNLALKKFSTVVYDVPDDSIYMIRTFLGKIKPRNVMVSPVTRNGVLGGALVLASINAYEKEDIKNVERVLEYLSIALDNGAQNDKNKRLANELAFQNKLIQKQQEENEARLLEKEELLRCAIKTAVKNAVLVLDDDSKIICWTKLAENIYGIRSERALGSDLERIHKETGIHNPEEAISEAKTNEKAKRVFEVADPTGENVRVELEFIKLGDATALGVLVRQNNN